MEKFFIRYDSEGEIFLIPEDKIKIFDHLKNKISILEELSDEWYDACEEFNRTFSKHKQEGEITSIPLWIKTNKTKKQKNNKND